MSYSVKSLDEVVRFQNGGTPSKSVPEYFKGEIPWVSGADIGENGTLRPRNHITARAVSESSTNLVPKGTVLIVTRTSVGKVAIADRDLCFSQDITALTPHKSLDIGFLAAYLKTHSRYFLDNSRGATIKGISRNVLSGIRIPIPPLEAQRRITEVLDQADQLREQRRKSIALLDELVQSTFLEMFGDPEASWLSTTVEGVAAKSKGSIRTGPFGSQLLHDEFVDEGIAVLGIDNAVRNSFSWNDRRYITREKYRKLTRYKVFPGDVLITIMGTCGRSAVVPDDIPEAINTKHLCCITTDQGICLPQFLHDYFLTHPIARAYLQRTTKGAIMSGLNMGIIKALPVELPPMQLQREYVSKLERLQEHKLRLTSGLSNLDALFASLQARAFKGELWQD